MNAYLRMRPGIFRNSRSISWGFAVLWMPEAVSSILWAYWPMRERKSTLRIEDLLLSEIWWRLWVLMRVQMWPESRAFAFTHASTRTRRSKMEIETMGYETTCDPIRILFVKDNPWDVRLTIEALKRWKWMNDAEKWWNRRWEWSCFEKERY